MTAQATPSYLINVLRSGARPFAQVVRGLGWPAARTASAQSFDQSSQRLSSAPAAPREFSPSNPDEPSTLRRSEPRPMAVDSPTAQGLTDDGAAEMTEMAVPVLAPSGPLNQLAAPQPIVAEPIAPPATETAATPGLHASKVAEQVSTQPEPQEASPQEASSAIAVPVPGSEAPPPLPQSPELAGAARFASSPAPNFDLSPDSSPPAAEAQTQESLWPSPPAPQPFAPPESIQPVPAALPDRRSQRRPLSETKRDLITSEPVTHTGVSSNSPQPATEAQGREPSRLSQQPPRPFVPPTSIQPALTPDRRPQRAPSGGTERGSVVPESAPDAGGSASSPRPTAGAQVQELPWPSPRPLRSFAPPDAISSAPTPQADHSAPREPFNAPREPLGRVEASLSAPTVHRLEAREREPKPREVFPAPASEPVLRDTARAHGLPPRRERAPKLTIQRLDIHIINQSGQTPAPPVHPAPRAATVAQEARDILDRHLLGRFDLS